MQLSQWELLQGSCVSTPAKSILNPVTATNDRKSYDERKSVRLHLQSEVFLRKMLQIQRRKQLKTPKKNAYCCLCFHPSWTSPAIESLAPGAAGWDPEPCTGKACLGKQHKPQACLFGNEPTRKHTCTHIQNKVYSMWLQTNGTWW